MVPVLVAAIIFPVAWVVATQLAGPDDGTLVTLPGSLAGERSWTAGVVIKRVYGPGSSLRSGDVVTAIGGRSLATLAASSGPRRHAGELVWYTYRRHGARGAIAVRLHGFDLLAAFSRNLQVFVVPLVLLAVAAFVFARRPDERPAQLMLAVGALFLAGTGQWPLGLRTIDFGGGRGVWPYVGRPWLAGGCYLLPFALYGLGLLLALPQAHVPLVRLVALTGVSGNASRVVPLVLIVLFVFADRRTTEPADRQRLRYGSPATI